MEVVHIFYTTNSKLTYIRNYTTQNLIGKNADVVPNHNPNKRYYLII